MSNDSRRGADLEEVVPRWDRVRLNSQPAERILCTLIRPAFSVAEGVPGLVFGDQGPVRSLVWDQLELVAQLGERLVEPGPNIYEEKQRVWSTVLASRGSSAPPHNVGGC